MLWCSGSSSRFGALLKGTSVVVLRVERALYIHSPHLQFLPARDLNSQPLDYESDSLTIRPRLSQTCENNYIREWKPYGGNGTWPAKDNSSSDHQWSTTKPIMLDDVAGSLILSMASTDSFTSVTCSTWNCSQPRRVLGTNGGSANSGVLWQMPIKLHSTGLCQHRSHYRMLGPSYHPYGACFWQFIQNHSYQ